MESAFLSTPSARRATRCPAGSMQHESISIHALREEGDHGWPEKPRIPLPFLSTPSARRATAPALSGLFWLMISIHALREEGDGFANGPTSTASYFYPRPPRGGRPRTSGGTSNDPNFYPRPPRGGRLDDHYGRIRSKEISIHALREEGDQQEVTLMRTPKQFLSTPSARRATGGRSSRWWPPTISIHALREEGDMLWPTELKRHKKFLSTPSARRATKLPPRKRSSQKNFYPRPPRGGRQQKQRQNLYFQTNCTTFCTNLEEP